MTIDHYLAKTGYPEYAVTPLNLVPSCSDCNKIKSTEGAAHAGEQFLHPYFDDVSDGVWLYSELVEVIPPFFRFVANPPQVWNDVKRERTLFHFQELELAAFYGIKAGEELSGLRYEMVMIGGQDGGNEVRSHLVLRAAARVNVDRNSWQAAMYTALAASPWFWNGRYLHIPQPG